MVVVQADGDDTQFVPVGTEQWAARGVVWGGGDDLIGAVKNAAHQRLVECHQAFLSDHVRQMAYHRRLAGGRAPQQMQGVAEWPGKVIVEHVSPGGLGAKGREGGERHPAGGYLQVAAGLDHQGLVPPDRFPRRGRAQGKDAAVHPFGAGVAADLADQLLAAPLGVGKVGAVDMQDPQVPRGLPPHQRVVRP